MKKPALVLLALGVLALIFACGRSIQKPTSTPPSVPSSPAATPSFESPSTFTLSIEYAMPGLAETFARTGVRYAKPMPIYGVWGGIEPEPGVYDWKPLDALVLEYQAAGFTGLQLLLTSESRWAQRRSPQGLDKGDSFPKEEYLDEYALFVRRVVERYDADGTEDMPGLRFPIRHYGVEREFTGYWPSGDHEDYLRLLRIAYPAIKAADPQSEVLLVALLLGDIFNGSPSPDVVELRLKQPKILNYSADAVLALLEACDAYDAVDFHSLGDYTEIPATAAWIRAQLQANGCGERPIWIGDAFSMSGLIGYADPFGLTQSKPFIPATDATRDAVLLLLQAVADPRTDEHAEATAWLQAEMARGLVRKVVVSAGQGLAGINIGNQEDWAMPNAPEINKGVVRSIGTSAFMGMIDVTLTNKRAGGPIQGVGGGDVQSRIRKPGESRPAYYALELVAGQIAAFTSVERLDLAAGVWAYRFQSPGGPLWVVWYDDGLLHLPGDPPPERPVSLSVGSARAAVTSTPTTAAERRPRTEQVDSSEGVVTLQVGATPLFVRPSP